MNLGKEFNFVSISLTIILTILPLSSPLQAQQTPYDSSKDSIILRHEFRGAWLTTVNGLDWPKKIKIDYTRQEGESDNEMKLRIAAQRDSQKTALVEIIKQIKSTRCNAVMMQIVCNSETYYPSDILPWDFNLTGVQGEDPGYDPLALAVETAHAQGLEIHAWLNPLRIGAATNIRTDSHPCKLHPEFVHQYGTTLYWDPGNSEVIDYLYNLVTEIVTRYDVDGVHIDDYFYPEGFRENPDQTQWDDEHLYEKYLSEREGQEADALSLEEWRESRVNAIIRAMYTATHGANPNAVFGVSPGGRLINTQRLYADPQYWVAEGTIDYLAPQIYWQHGHEVADFKLVLESWKEIMNDIPTIPGLAAFRFRSKEFDKMEEYKLQVEECRNADYNVVGNIWFTTSSLLDKEFLSYMQEVLYPYESLTPTLGYAEYPAPCAPVAESSKSLIRWKTVEGATGYAVYELSPEGRTSQGGTLWRANMIKRYGEGGEEIKGELLEFEGEKGKNYALLSYRGKRRSPLSNVVTL